MQTPARRTPPPPTRSAAWLSRDNSSRRGARRLFRRRDYECDPGVPAVGPVLVGEFPVALEIEVTLRRGAEGNNESELRTHADHLRLEAADAIAGAAVATQLSVDVADEPDLKLLGQELRRAPIEMHVDPVLILGRLIGEIVGEAEDAGEFVPDLRIEVGVAAAGVDGAMADADVRQTRRVVGPNRYVAGDIGHVIVHAVVPAQRRDRQDISEAAHRVADAVEAREWERAQRRRQRACNCPR